VHIGSGLPLLYLHSEHGLDSALPIIHALATHFDVTAPARPGFGSSDLPRSFSTVDDLAYFYLDWLDQSGHPEVVLAGTAFGAWIAAEIAIKSTTKICPADAGVAGNLRVRAGSRRLHQLKEFADR
jgi:pimeloyl-ACP methyl ester carboxylesterase